MKKLDELVVCPYKININSIEDDSRIRVNNALFCCIEGLTVDGHNYIEAAIKNGAVAILASKRIEASIPVIQVKDTNQAMISVLSNFYNKVDEKLKLIGITGTDGKTTVASMIYQLINNIDKCGLIGTNGITCSDFEFKTDYTTPFPKELFNIFNNFYNNKCYYVAMEVSSERLLTKRIDYLKFDVAVFTNLTYDHMDKHKTFANYRDSKAKLFQMLKETGYAIINADDKYSGFFQKKTKGLVLTYGIEQKADIRASKIIISKNELQFTIDGLFGTYHINSPLSGMFNVYNIMASIGVCYILGFDMKKIIDSIENLEPIKGRLNIIESNCGFKVLIDYAHTPNALKNLLQYVKVATDNNIITITGSAGGRDKLKRPEMGKVVTSLSDYVIFTTDDPRNEDPNDIIDQLISKVNTHNYERIIDRSLAIKRAISLAKKGDVVVIAGRGDDTFMPIGNTVIRCNDKEEVFKYLSEKKLDVVYKTN